MSVSGRKETITLGEGELPVRHAWEEEDLDLMEKQQKPETCGNGQEPAKKNIRRAWPVLSCPSVFPTDVSVGAKCNPRSL